MADLVRAEARKLLTGGGTWSLLLIGIGLGGLFTEGFTQAARELLSSGASDPATQTAVIVRSWFAMTLVSGILGALSVTREYASGTISRSVLVAGSRSRLFGAKALTGTAAGLVLGVVAAALAVGYVHVAMPRTGAEVVWSHEATMTALGIVGTTTLSATWGVLLGWILRHQVAAILVIVGLTLLVEPGVQSFAPEVAGYLFTIAMTGVNLDGKEGLLSIGGSYAVLVGWILVLGAAARALVARRDLT
ncbi:ABC transporter permease [Georgenia faecalis]|uniref:ABC transporter permease n=1 Tax=Georgenia faecalis TaxID=2483799 RepID=A0ABV9DCP6_9MICO|nr:ABC transporter permease [Georgenia faecalis]